jgi:hypothetical protein
VNLTCGPVPIAASKGLTQMKAGCTQTHADGIGSPAGAPITDESIDLIAGGVRRLPPLATRPGCSFSLIPSAFISVHPTSSA